MRLSDEVRLAANSAWERVTGHSRDRASSRPATAMSMFRDPMERRRLIDRIAAEGHVSNVELKHIDLNESMIRAIAKQAEAERLRRAKVIDAEGELQAAERLLQAGEILSKRSEAMQLRYLGALLNIAGEKSNTIVFPLPMDLAKSLGVGEKKG